MAKPCQFACFTMFNRKQMLISRYIRIRQARALSNFSSIYNKCTSLSPTNQMEAMTSKRTLGDLGMSGWDPFNLLALANLLTRQCLTQGDREKKEQSRFHFHFSDTGCWFVCFWARLGWCRWLIQSTPFFFAHQQFIHTVENSLCQGSQPL